MYCLSYTCCAKNNSCVAHEVGLCTVEYRLRICDFLEIRKMYSEPIRNFYRAMLCISAVYAVMRCPSVCPSVHLSVTFVDRVKTNKHIFEIFSPSGSHTILVFRYQTGWRYSYGHPSRWGIGRNRDSGLIVGYRRLLTCEVTKTVTDDHAV